MSPCTTNVANATGEIQDATTSGIQNATAADINEDTNPKNSKLKAIAISASAVVVVLLISMCVIVLLVLVAWKKRKRKSYFKKNMEHSLIGKDVMSSL